MAAPFLYGPYYSISSTGLLPGAGETWMFGPWRWVAKVIAITAHPFPSGIDETLQVTSVSTRVDRYTDGYLYCTVRNVGDAPANYGLWIGGVES